MLPLSDIHESISELCRQLEELVEQIAKAGDEAAHAESTFRADFAKARLHARAEADGRKITVDEVEDRAAEKTQDQRLNYLLTSQNLLVLREAMRARQAQLDGFRTLAASHRVNT